MPDEQSVIKEKILYFFNKNKREVTAAAVAFFIAVIYVFFFAPPSDYPQNSIFYLKSGETLSSVSSDLKSDNIIRSEFLFKSFVYIFSFGDSTVIEGDYALNARQNVITLAWRIVHGELDIVPVKLTIFEGMNSFEIANAISKKFPSFDEKVFLGLVEKGKLEGYLFPDTYYIMPNASEEDIVKIMNDNFNEKLKELTVNIKQFGKSQSDIIKMASILEEEARTFETRQIIAGILWRRMAIGMPLQVDASFKYINGKTTATLTTDDLKTDSPYNSYTNRGLPPTPITNPGLNAIKAAIMPTKTPYLYFLSDENGNMHYAATFDEHVDNKQKYLR